jgi:hypothetical protein
MIPTITKELEGFKAKVQATIDHVASGVSNLNEDQQEKAAEMLHNLGEAFYDAKDRCFEALGVETLTARLAKAQADEADRNAAKSPATTTGAVEWSGGIKEKLEDLKEKVDEEVHQTGSSLGNALGEAFDNRGQ